MPLFPALSFPPQFESDQTGPECVSCGYSLRGLTSQTRCPECGHPFDPNGPPVPSVPWLHRQRVGIAKAYAETAWMVLRHPDRFAREMRRPGRVSSADADQFRKLSIHLCVFGITMSVLSIGIPSCAYDLSRLTFFQWLCLLASVGVGVGFLWIIISLCTLGPVWFWMRGGYGNHLVGIAAYGTAPMALWAIVGVIATVGTGLFELAGSPESSAIIWTMFFFLWISIEMVLIWWIPQVLMHRGLPCSHVYAAKMGLFLPVYWLLVIFLIGISAVFLLGLMLTSSGIIQ
jgi:hypothetical protein